MKEINYYIFKCSSLGEIKAAVGDIFNIYHRILPVNYDALILLKPNCNSDMNALTGNTTDLRLIVAVVESLIKFGYRNIVIGDGPNAGLINMNIDGLARLRIHQIAAYYGIRSLDLNKAPYKEVDIDDQIIRVAQVCFDAELFINLPKIKTHSEAGFSCALKNLMGCVVGFDKQKVHENLHRNLYLLNQIVKPHLHIVDGLIGMEGTGPSSGIPVKLDLVIAGESPVQVDWVASSVAGLDYCSIPLLRMAIEEGVGHDTVASWQPVKTVKNFRKPAPPFLQRIITNPSTRPWFVRFRYMPVINKLFSTELWSKILYALKGGQEKYISADAEMKGLVVTQEKCDLCHDKPCLNYCPMGVHPADPKDKCIACAYCYLACPYDAIKINGDLGYLNFQFERYEGMIRQVLTRVIIKE